MYSPGFKNTLLFACCQSKDGLCPSLKPFRSFFRTISMIKFTPANLKCTTHPRPFPPPVASCHVIYGERIGLFSSSPSLESQKFIWAVERMLATTPPLLYLPPRLLLRIGAPLWTQHASAWDHIFSHGMAVVTAWVYAPVYLNLRSSCSSLSGGEDPERVPATVILQGWRD